MTTEVIITPEAARGMSEEEARRKYDELRDEGKSITQAADRHKEHPGQFTADQQQRIDSIFAAMDLLESAHVGVGGLGRQTPIHKPASPDSGPTRQPGHIAAPPAEAPRSGRVGARYEDLFPDAANDSGGFQSFGEFANVLYQGVRDDRLMPAVSAATGHVGMGGDGGYMIPTQMVGFLLNQSLESEIVRPRARTIPLTSGSVKAPGFDVEDNSSSIGGFSGQWLNEGEKLDWQKGLIRSITLTARKLGILTSASNELVSDSPFFDSELIAILSQAVAFYLDEAFLTGDGVGKPTGVINDSALVVVSKESGQAADTITFNNLKAMLNRLHPSMTNAVWVASSSTREQLLSLVQYIRNEADSENVGGAWVPAMREGGDGTWRILGLPVLFSEKLPSLGDQGDIVLADFSQYFVGLAQSATLRTSEDVLFDSDEIAWRITARVDGQGRWSKALTPRKGQSLSWCVSLAKRA